MSERSFRRLLLIFALSISFTAPVVAAEKGIVKNQNAAIVNGTAIPMNVFEKEVESMKNRYQHAGQKMDDKSLNKLRNDIADGLIARELLYQESQKQNIAISPQELDQQLEALKKRFPSNEEFKRQLAAMNISEEELKGHFKMGLAIKRFVDVQVASKVSVTEEEKKSYYNGNIASFKRQEQVRGQHILVKVDKGATEQDRVAAKKKIDTIKGKLSTGGNFEALAKEYSDCPSGRNGGDLGYFTRGKMVKPFEDAAFSLKIGETSGIIETDFGYHIIRVLDKKAEGTVSYDEAVNSIEAMMKQQKIQGELERYIQELTAKSKIDRFL
ncbi:MAG: peptidylprolyl isomerase [Deltaproteobacteria bacterium]|nr:peptidylprolyl isomerase [Deltaproteobacteria bacterium]